MQYTRPTKMSYRLRPATLADRDELSRLIARSARALGAGLYEPAQIEGALRGAFGVDSQLIRDGTYYAVLDDATIVGCGGWSWRQTLFGGDDRAERSPAPLDPAVDPAKIRAFFVDPAHARRGIARLIYDRCEAAAREAGFGRLELMGTLPGVPFYERCGFVAEASIEYELEPGLTIEFVPMHKTL